MSRKQHRIRKKLDIYAMYEQELEEELRKGLQILHDPRDAAEIAANETRMGIMETISHTYKNNSDRECFTSEHPNHNK